MRRINVFMLMLLCAGAGRAEPPVKLWETDAVFSGPESVAYDAERDLLYVSNLRKTEDGDGYYGDQFLSKVSLSGEVLELKWVKGLSEPTGIVVHDDRLYAVERFGVVVVDLKTGTIVHRIRVDGERFLNDIDVAPDGTVFVSDSGTADIYTIRDGKVEKWYSDEPALQTNGVLVDDGRLLIAANADAALKAIDLKSKQVNVVAPIRRGVIDGIRPAGADALVSLLEGRLYRVTDDGDVTEVLDTTGAGINIADFEYIEDKRMLIAPALWQHKLVAYRLR